MKRISSGIRVHVFLWLGMFALFVMGSWQLQAQKVQLPNNIEVGGVVSIGLGFNDYPEVNPEKDSGYDIGNGENTSVGVSLGVQGFGNFPIFVLPNLYVSPYFGYNVTIYSIAEDAAPLFSPKGGQMTLHSLRYGVDATYRFPLQLGKLTASVAPLLGFRLDSNFAGNIGDEDTTLEYEPKALGTYASLVLGGEFILPLTERFKIPFRLKGALNLGTFPAVLFDIYAEVGFLYSFPR